ncbi:MAG: hypothetical protein MN733_42875 [Nitrososphaera sp.]|nr:hypothetical protein [Nitrososphaera sp.]
MTKSSIKKLAFGAMMVTIAFGVFLSVVGLPTHIVKQAVAYGGLSLACSLIVPLWLLMVHKSSWTVANTVAAVALTVWGFSWSLAIFGHGLMMTAFIAIMVGLAISLVRLCINEAVNSHFQLTNS